MMNRKSALQVTEGSIKILPVMLKNSFMLLRLKPCQCDKVGTHSLGNDIRDVWPWFQKAIKGGSLTKSLKV